MKKLRKEYFAAYFASDTRDALPPSFGIVTACNPKGKVATDERNEAADSELESYLQTTRLPHFRVTGRSQDGSHREPGFAIACENPEIIRHVAQMFEQEAFFWVVDGCIFVAHVSEA